MLSVGTLAKPVEGHATRRPADGYSRRGGEHGKRSGDLSNAPGEQDVPQARCNPPLAALKISGPAFSHVPADILSGGCARCSSSDRNTQRIEAKEKRCGEENRHLRFSSLRVQFMNGHALKGFAQIRESMVFVVVLFRKKLGLGFCEFVFIPNAVLISYGSPASFPDAGFPPSLITLSALLCAGGLQTHRREGAVRM
jgi:hypothetical protein